jgi:hypothetical protein
MRGMDNNPTGPPFNALRLGAAFAGAALRPAARAVEAGARLERRARLAAGRSAVHGTLALLDATLESRLAGEATERVLGSTLALRAVRRTLAGPLVEEIAHDVAVHAVIERVTEPLAASGALERIVDRALASATIDLLAERAIDSPAAERLVGRVIQSSLLDEAVTRLLESEDLWVLVEQIAQSPAVTDAIGRQGLSFADQMAGVVRDRSLSADDRVERMARRLIRRRRRDATVVAPGQTLEP